MNTNNSEISDSVVRKIQLLLKLAERTEGNEVEAAAAMGKAQELLAQYNLDLSTVQDKVVAGGSNTPEAAMAKRDYAKVSRSAMYNWQRKLVRAIAEANYCRYWVEETQETRWNRLCNVKRHKVLGRLVNTTAVLIMTDYLMETIERLVPYRGKEKLGRSAISWREGCAARLIERIQEKAEAMRTADYASQGEAAYSTAIAVRNMASQEEIGNYDFINGKGAWARRLENQAKWAEDSKQWAAQREERDAKELAELEAKLALETPEQKIKRLRREAKAEEASARYSARYWDRQDRKAEREAARRDHSAYAAGTRTAEKIGLDGQLKAARANKQLGGVE
jgi:Protein of unknown function (DUF2786)